MQKAILRAVTEMGIIVFLLYSTLLIGEFTQSGQGQGMSLVWAIKDILTPTNFAIAITAALFGHGVLRLLRNKF